MTLARLPGRVKFRPKTLRDAFTPEFHHPSAKVVWALRILLAGLALHALTVEPTYTTRPLLVGSALLGLSTSLLFAFVPTQRPRTLKAAEAATLMAVMGHVVGHTFGLYQNIKWYDTALHFTVPLVTVLILFALSQATDWIWDWRKVRPIEVFVYCFSMTVAIGVVWEINEFAQDQLAGTKEQDNLFDTMIDLIADTLGALIGAAFVAWVTRHGRRHGTDAVSEDIKRPVPSRAPTRTSQE